MTIGRIPSVEGGIQPTIVDAKGDLIAATAADTVNRLAVGSNDQVLVADSSTSTGLAWKSVATPFAAGKNRFINGDFGIWQRGTTFTNPGNLVYTADRFTLDYGGASGGTVAWSQQTFTPGTAPVAGYEGQYFARYNMSVASTGQIYNNPFEQRIEDVRTLAGQTVTFSAWVKSDSSRNFTLQLYQNFGSGGSTQTVAGISSTFTATTSWQRFTFTTTMPSVSGKTIGAGSHVKAILGAAANNTVQTIDTWGWQLEAGSVATPFQTATGTLQGELAACQRYYYRVSSDGTTATVLSTLGVGVNTTSVDFSFRNPVNMRVKPTSVDFSNLAVLDVTASRVNTTGVTLGSPGIDHSSATITGGSGLTANRPYYLYNQSAASGYIGFSAEL